MTDKEIIARQAEKIIELEDKVKELESGSIPVRRVYADDFSEIYIKAKIQANRAERMANCNDL
jgi:hypothetical protein